MERALPVWSWKDEDGLQGPRRFCFEIDPNALVDLTRPSYLSGRRHHAVGGINHKFDHKESVIYHCWFVLLFLPPPRAHDRISTL